MIQNIIKRIFPALAIILSLSASVALPREITEKYPSNSVLLNGEAVGLPQLSSINRGVISLVKGNPYAVVKNNVLFKVYLKRQGKLIDADKYAYHNAMVQYEISGILKFARAGDEIIIDPVDKNELASRRVIQVTPIQLVPHFDWFFIPNKKGDGC